MLAGGVDEIPTEGPWAEEGQQPGFFRAQCMPPEFLIVWPGYPACVPSWPWICASRNYNRHTAAHHTPYIAALPRFPRSCRTAALAAAAGVVSRAAGPVVAEAAALEMLTEVAAAHSPDVAVAAAALLIYQREA